MNRVWRWGGVAIILVFLLGLGYAGWRISRSSEPEVCQVCRRPIHSDTRTVAWVGTRREVFCCPACALTTHDQSGRPVRIVELTNYETNSPLAPAHAYLVRGSDMNLCALHQGPMDPYKQPTAVAYDRCSPSLLAFANREAAARFAREHGGAVLSFSELAAAYTQ